MLVQKGFDQEGKARVEVTKRVMMGALSTVLLLLSKAGPFPTSEDDMQAGSFLWWAYLGLSAGLVLFGGIMSGLTLGLMSLGPVELEILRRSGTEKQQKEAAIIIPVIQNQHRLLVTLLLCNAAAMEALPVFLDKIFHPLAAVVLSVTVVLAFGEVIPQAICSRYGLSVGANLLWLVRIAMFVCFPIAFPVGKILDIVLGHNNSAIFRRAQLKALVTIHGKEEGKGGDLSHDETTIIRGALDMTEKTAEDAMTPIESAFSLDMNLKLNWEAMRRILARGHSRIPVYSGNPRNIVGLLLVKTLPTVSLEAETPLSAVPIRRMPRVPAHMPLYDILNEFQKGSSHMAAVVRAKDKCGSSPITKRATYAIEDANPFKYHGSHGKRESNLNKTIDNINFEKDQMDKILCEPTKLQYSHCNDQDSSTTISGELEDVNEDEVIGIITLEDVIEELLQEEIVDETDEFIDVHKRIRVATACSMPNITSSLRRVGTCWATSMGARQGLQTAAHKCFSVGDVKCSDVSNFVVKIENLNTPLLTSACSA